MADTATAAPPENTTAAPPSNTTAAPPANTTAAPPSTVAAPPENVTVDPEKGYWPDDWRDRLAGNDEDTRKRLNRFQSPDGVFKSWRSFQQRLSSGELKANTPFPAEGTDEEKNAWRQERGIPPMPEAYLEKLPDGLVLGEEDKQLAGEFAQAMHAKNAPPEFVHAGLEWYNRLQEQVAAKRHEEDALFRSQADDELRSDWGQEYRGNINHIHATLFTNAPEVRDILFSARSADGKLLGNHPLVLKWLAGTAKEVNPAGTILPNTGGDRIKDIDTRIQQLELKMANRHEWFKDTAAQAEYRELVTARDKLRARAA